MLAVMQQYWHVTLTDTCMDGQTSCDSVVCTMHGIMQQKLMHIVAFCTTADVPTDPRQVGQTRN